MLILLPITVHSQSSYNRLPQTYWSTTTNSYYLIVSVGQESEFSLTEFSALGCLTGCSQSISQISVSSEGLTEGESPPSSPACLLAWGPQFFAGWRLGTSSRYSSCGPLCRAALNVATGFHQREHVRERRQAREQPEYFYNQILEETSHHFYCILFFRKKSPAIATHTGRDYTKTLLPGSRMAHRGPSRKLPPPDGLIYEPAVSLTLDCMTSWPEPCLIVFRSYPSTA